MANHKRKKSRRQVRCTLCTQVRWMGNTKARKDRQALRAETDLDVWNRSGDEALSLLLLPGVDHSRISVMAEKYQNDTMDEIYEKLRKGE